MDIKPIISNPWVLGGGVVIGLVLLAVNGQRGHADSGEVYSPSAAVQSAMAAQAAAGQDYAYKMAMLASDQASQRSSFNVQTILGFLSFLENQQQVAANTAVQMRAVDNEIVRTRIENQTIRYLDDNAQMTRLAQSYIAADVSKYGMDTQLKLQKEQDFTQLAVAGQQFTAALSQQGAGVFTAGLNLIPKLLGV